jgi:hypothetical protein
MRVFRRELVAVDAVSALRLLAPPHVFSMGDRFQVRRIDARPVSAQVVEIQTIWDRPNESLIDEPVARELTSARNPNPCVAVAADHAADPATIRLLGHFR